MLIPKVGYVNSLEDMSTKTELNSLKPRSGFQGQKLWGVGG